MDDLFSSGDSGDEKVHHNRTPHSSEAEEHSDGESERDAAHSDNSDQSDQEASDGEEERPVSDGEQNMHSGDDQQSDAEHEERLPFEVRQSDAESGEHQSDAESEGPRSDAESEGSRSDAESEGHRSDAESEGHRSDAESEDPQSDAESGHHSDAKSGQQSNGDSEGHQSDAESEGHQSGAGSTGHRSDAESSGQQSDAESSGHQSDAESGGHQSDAGSGGHQSPEESEGRQSDAESEEHQSDAEYEKQRSDIEVEPSDRQQSDNESYAESEGQQSGAESDSQHSDAESEGQHSLATSDRQQSANEAEHERSGADSGTEDQQHHVEQSDHEESEEASEHVDESDAEQSDSENIRHSSRRETREEVAYQSGDGNSEAENENPPGSLSERISDNEERLSDHENKSEMSDDEEQQTSKSRKSLSSDEEHSEIDSDAEVRSRRKRKLSNDVLDEDSDNENKRRKRTFMTDDEVSGSEEEIGKKRKQYLQDGDDDNRGRFDRDENVRHVKKKIKSPDDSSDERLLGDDGSPKATAHDLFGEDVADISSEDELALEAKDKGERDDTLNGDVERQSPTAVGDDDVPTEEPIPETRIEVEIPRITTNLGKEIHFVKLPNFLSVDTRPYDPQWYEDEIDEDEMLDEEGRARVKLKVENTMRWRQAYDDLGNSIKESNARIVKWSDGSYSFHLGSEVFDVYRQTLMQGDHNHLYVRQGTGLQGQAVFRTKLTFRPHSTESFTHRKMTISLADRNQKAQMIRVLPTVGQDPEAHRSEMIKKEEDRLKASIRREGKQRRMKEKSHSRGLNASYLEPDRYEDEDDGTISLSAIKNKYKKGGAALKDRPSIYSSDEDGSEEDHKAKRLEKAKSMDDQLREDEDDDSDLDYFDKKNASDGKKKTVAIEESDDDE